MILKILLLASVLLNVASTPVNPESRQDSVFTSGARDVDEFLEEIANETFQELDIDEFVQDTMNDILEDQLEELKENQDIEKEELEDVHERQLSELEQLQEEELDELEYMHDIEENALENNLVSTQVNNRIWKDSNEKHLLGLLNSVVVRILDLYGPIGEENSKIYVNDKLMPDSTLLEKAQHIKSSQLMKINSLKVKEKNQLENSLASLAAEKTEDKRNNIRTYMQNKLAIFEEQLEKDLGDKMQQDLEKIHELGQEAQIQLENLDESQQLYQTTLAEQLQNKFQLENQIENQFTLEQEPENPLIELEHLLNHLEIIKEQKIQNQHREQQEIQNQHREQQEIQNQHREQQEILNKHREQQEILNKHRKQQEIQNQLTASTPEETEKILQQFLDIKEHVKQQDTPSTFHMSFDLQEGREVENEPHSRSKRAPREKRLLGAFNFGNFNKKSEDRLDEIKVRVNELLMRISEFEKIRAKASSLKVLDKIEKAFSNRCPPNTNSLRVGDKCFEHVTNLWMDYDSALIYCAGRGGALAKPDLEDDNYLTNLRDTFPGLADNSVLVGITDIHQEGTFQFQDGAPAGHERFYESKHPVYAEKDCVSLTPYQGFGLVDTACDRLHEVLCEYDMVNLLTVNQ